MADCTRRYFLLHSIDLAVQQAGTTVAYNYIVFQSLNTVWRTLSDIALLCGCWLTLKRYETPKVTISIFEWIIAGTLWFLGLYKLGLQFALCFAWLDFVDLGKIDSIAAARSGFDVAFATIYFVATLFIACALCPESNEKFLAPREPFKHINDPQMNACKERYRQEGEMVAWASYCLLVRAFCEVIIVGQLDRAPGKLLKIYEAQDVCYTLFSFLFVFFIACSIPSSLERDSDPWELESKISARLAEEQRVADEALQVTLQNSLNEWPEQADKLFKERLATVTESGTKSAPVVSVVLDILRDQVQQEGSDERLVQGKLDHLTRMAQDIQDWVPVYKWDRRSDDENVAGGEES
ncbi:hypothetical protein CEP54_011658 [Fusarium duplospermum]|uniref:Uncharacterized protein n=1 Tax=Fusarium duplospermum TaxID=1325734 RepID=A0A428PD76_9HYPO|nr:hypothetical protein CEP54_011658 [Fusarium duplospermum]